MSLAGQVGWGPPQAVSEPGPRPLLLSGAKRREGSWGPMPGPPGSQAGGAEPGETGLEEKDAPSDRGSRCSPSRWSAPPPLPSSGFLTGLAQGVPRGRQAGGGCEDPGLAPETARGLSAGRVVALATEAKVSAPCSQVSSPDCSRERKGHSTSRHLLPRLSIAPASLVGPTIVSCNLAVHFDKAAGGDKTDLDTR